MGYLRFTNSIVMLYTNSMNKLIIQHCGATIVMALVGERY